MPQLWVVGGPNGAGKSTLASRRLAERVPFVNPDDIARRIQPSGQATTQTIIAAGRQAAKEQDRLIAAGASFGLETTLSGKRELAIMSAAKDAGYTVNLVYIGLAGPDASAARVKTRVAAGGHDVPHADIIRRYPRSIENLGQAMERADRAYVLDNSGERRRLLLTAEAARVEYATKDLPEWAKAPLAKTLAGSR